MNARDHISRPMPGIIPAGHGSGSRPGERSIHLVITIMVPGRDSRGVKRNRFLQEPRLAPSPDGPGCEDDYENDPNEAKYAENCP
jgi:hypothetical protein